LVQVSVVIVNHNGRDDLEELLESLARQTRPADEVILIDNASTDDSVAYVRDQFPWVRVIALNRNVGFAAGNNEGLANACGDYIALLNPDTTVDPRWLGELARVLDADEGVAAAVPKIYRSSAPCIVEQAGAEFSNLGHYWTRGFNQPDRGQFSDVIEVPGLTGCSTLVRRSALAGEPVFDGNLFMYYEEFDLTLRLRGRGHRVVFVPSAVVYHKGMQSIARATRQPNLMQQYFCNRNRLKILCKYYPLPLVARNLPLIALSVAYWDMVFLRRAGPAFCLRAAAGQARYAVQGLRERQHAHDIDPAGWLPWMTRHRLRDVRALRVARGEA
jgi:GT2 family glycosyltransferase